MDLRLVSSAAPVREQAVEKLQYLLVSGRFAPGERLKERVLIELLNTSRTTIREALRQLEADGLVTMVPGSGPVVATVTVQDVRDLYEVREVLESLAVRLFCERSSDEQVLQLRTSLDALKEAHLAGGPPGILAAKQAFYNVLFSGTENTSLGALVERLQVRVSRVRLASLSQPDRIAVGVAELLPVVEAINRRDVTAAEDAYRFHMSQARAAAIRAVEALRESIADIDE
ncbi:MAG: GntR family transcriptional regulator [Acidimicrobiales bacterium]